MEKSMEKSKFILTLFILAAVIIACGRGRDKNEDDETSKEKIERYSDKDEESEETEEKKLVYGNPYLLQGTPYVLIPLSMSYKEENIFNKFKREYFSPEQYYSKYSERYDRFDYSELHNIIFYNSSDSSSYSLLNRKALINKFYIPSSREADTSRGKFIIFSLIEEDYNNDEEIDEDDGETVYKCSIFGTDIRQISPDRIQLIDWEANDANDMILLYVRDDVNRDKKFDTRDETKILGTSITNSNIGKEILNDSLRNSMKTLYGK